MNLISQIQTSLYSILPVVILLLAVLIITLIIIFILDKFTKIKNTSKYYKIVIIASIVVFVVLFLVALVNTPEEINERIGINHIGIQ